MFTNLANELVHQPVLIPFSFRIFGLPSRLRPGVPGVLGTFLKQQLRQLVGSLGILQPAVGICQERPGMGSTLGAKSDGNAK